MDNTVVSDSTHETALVLANAGTLAAKIITRIAGNDISTAVNGSPLTRNVIQNLVMRKMERVISSRKSV